MKIILKKNFAIRQLDVYKKRLEKILGEKKGKIAIDISAVEKIDTAFLQAFLSVMETCKRSGKQFEIRGRTQAFNLILECYGINL